MFGTLRRPAEEHVGPQFDGSESINESSKRSHCSLPKYSDLGGELQGRAESKYRHASENRKGYFTENF
jgi:hypothetical protein